MVSTVSDGVFQQASLAFATANYAEAIAAYEQLIELEPEVISHRWWLGLAYLLQGFETEAQLTWSLALSEAEPEQLETWTSELVDLLSAAADQQASVNQSMAWTIRQHIREIAPTDLPNLIQSLLLADAMAQLTPEVLTESGLVEVLQAETMPLPETVSTQLLTLLKRLLLQYADLLVVHQLSQAFAQRIADPAVLIELLLKQASDIAYVQRQIPLACRYAEIALELDNNHLEAIRFLAIFYRLEHNYAGSIEMGQRYCNLSQTAVEKLVGQALVLQTLTKSGGDWQQAADAYQQQKAQLQTWLETEEAESQEEQWVDISLFTLSFFTFQYLEDLPCQIRPLQNQVAQRYQASFMACLAQEKGADYWQQNLGHYSPVFNKKLRIGCISSCFYRHSVGWLARWLMQHHDREQFEIYIYHTMRSQVDEFGQRWYVQNATRACCLNGDALGIAEEIRSHEIDILVDLDSLTNDQTCAVMALKPAPIQVTWLGQDASGLPTIDYFIADRYVLPDNAQDYYREKIWRMPHSYIAVDGFEVGVPSIRRSDLNIPEDSIIYLSSQAASKRYPETVRLQMQILKQVSDSYLMIKGIGDEQAVQNLFRQIALEEGVAEEQLRFLGFAPAEEIHRANLGIADVVLDTFPYNGATTTLETLWMGIPLVTKVGQQFVSRNSYTMMMNAGITEGIAWNDQEYVEWGVRLGKDAELRREISWRLHQSRQTAPLWNAEQFARDMETAYRQMWQWYLSAP